MSEPRRFEWATDELKYLIIARKLAMSINNKTLAREMGVSPQKIGRLMRKHTSEWDIKTLAYICKRLHISEAEYRAKIPY